jgi:hypothetical protein
MSLRLDDRTRDSTLTVVSYTYEVQYVVYFVRRPLLQFRVRRPPLFTFSLQDNDNDNDN